MDTIIIEAPWFSHALAGGMMLVGVLLWLFGGRALRVVFAVAGAVGGMILALMIPADIASGAMRVLLVLGCGLFGALLGGAAFRFSVAFVLAGALSVITPLLVAEGIDRYGSPVEQRDPDQPLTDAEMALPGVPFTTGDINPGAIFDDQEAAYQARQEVDPTPATTTPETRLEVWLGRCEAFLWELAREMRDERWAQLPPRDKSLIVLASLTGIVLGLALGMGAQRMSSVMLASGVGGVLFLPSAVWLMHATKVPTEWLPVTAGAWVIAWIGLSAIGSLTQRYLIQPRLKKSSKGGGGEGNGG